MVVDKKVNYKVLFQDLLYLFSLSFLHVLINGYYLKNGPYQLFTFVKVFTYKNMYLGDMIRTHGIRSLLIPILSVFERLNCIEHVAFGGYLLCLFFFYLISFKLARLISTNKYSEYLSVLFLLFAKPVLGGVEAFARCFSFSMISTPLVLFVLYLMLKERYISGAVLLGITFNLHPIAALPLYLFFFFVVFFLKPKNEKNIIPALILSFILALPLVIWRFASLPISNAFFLSGPWYQIVKIRSSHNFFPLASQYNFDELIYFVLALLVMVSYKGKNIYQNKAKTFSSFLILLCAGNCVVIHFFPVGIMLQMQLYRATLLIMLCAFIFLSDYVVGRLLDTSNAMRIFLLFSICLFVANQLLIFMVLLNLWFLCRLFIVRDSMNEKSRAVVAICMISLMLFMDWQHGHKLFERIGQNEVAIEIDFPRAESWDRGYNPQWMDTHYG